jgi:hypothetical protein
MMLLEAHYSKFERYYFNKPMMGSGETFRLPMSVGGKASLGDTYTIELFYIDEDVGKFVLGIGGTGPAGDEGQGFTRSLPPGAESVHRRTVHRDQRPETAKC